MCAFTYLIDRIENAKIQRYVDENIDSDFLYCDDWTSEVREANNFLRKLLIRKGRKAGVKESQLSDALGALYDINNKRRLGEWVSGINTKYMPLLEKYWDD